VAFAVGALACFAIAAALLVRMHLLPTGLNPVRDAISDYGATAHHRNYRAMVVALGGGAVLLAIGLQRDTDATALFWLWLYGASRIVIAAFMIDVDGPPFTWEGRIHWLLAAVAFTSIAFAATSIDWTGAPGVLRPLGWAVAASAVGTLLTIRAPAIFGLVERLLYLTSVAWLVIAAIGLASG
jgi:hypothetical protein